MKRTRILLAGVAVLLGGGPLALADYPTYIAGTNPVGWWGFNDSAGNAAAITTADLSGAYGAANNGAGLNVNMTYNAPGVTTATNEAGFGGAGMGAGNKATFFNGNPEWTNQVLHPGATGNGVENLVPQSGDPVYMPGTVGISAEVWIKLPGTYPNGPGDSERVMGRREWAFGFQCGNPTGLLHFTTFGIRDFFSTTPLSLVDQQWHQIGFTWQAGTASFYIDGAPAGTEVTGTGILGTLPSGSTNNTFNLGRRRIENGPNLGESQEFYGWMDEAVIWSGVRTAQDYLDSWNAAHTGASPANITANPTQAAGLPSLGDVGVNTIASPQTVTLTNIGDLAGNITSASVTGPFTVTPTAPAMPINLVKDASQAFSIQLDTLHVPGSVSGVATFVTDIVEGAGFRTFTYNLSANIIAHDGDVNGDGQVSLLDYNIIKVNFGNVYEDGNHWADGDVNGDLQVGLLDFNIVKAHFGHTTGDSPLTAVPEPATLALLALAGLAALRRKR